MLKVGGHVIFHDSVGVPHSALVTAIHGNIMHPCINLVFVRSEEYTDEYGRQIHRESSVVHKSSQEAHGNYYRLENERPNPVARSQI
jgi:hypothetical protein